MFRHRSATPACGHEAGTKPGDNVTSIRKDRSSERERDGDCQHHSVGGQQFGLGSTQSKC